MTHWFGDSHQDDESKRQQERIDQLAKEFGELSATEREHNGRIIAAYLRAIERDERYAQHKSSAALDELIRLQKEANGLLRQLVDEGKPPASNPVAKFIITQQGDPIMPTQGPLTGVAPGLTGVFTAATFGADGNPATLPAGIVPVWTSDDPTDVVTTNPDGLGASVAVAATATPGGVHTLSVANPDGSAASPAPLPILGTPPPPPNPVTQFVISQVS